VVAEGQLDIATVEALALVVDFLGVGEEIWREDDAGSALARLLAPLN
jgi:thiamine-phosphate pyrophosphorylase